MQSSGRIKFWLPILSAMILILAAVSVISYAEEETDHSDAEEPDYSDTAESGFVEKDGLWYYYDEDGGIVSSDIVQDPAGEVYEKGAGTWWYIEDSIVKTDYTGLAQNEYGWWYVKDGMVDFSHNGVDQNDYGWWYVTGGKVQFGYTGVANYANDYGWWYISGGKVDFCKTSVEQNDYGWWYVLGGKVDF